MKKCVVITGASSGIGKALAQCFSEAGYSVALLARNLEKMQSYNLPDSLCVKVDVTDFAALEAAITQVEETLGPIDCFINNAGVLFQGDFTDIGHREQEHMVAVNLQGVINGCEAVLPKMVQREQGTVINISSVADRNSRPSFAVYAATKAAVKSLSESLRAAYAAKNIRVSNIAPGAVDTPMIAQAQLFIDHLVDVDVFAKTLLGIYELPQSVCIRDMVIAPTGYAGWLANDSEQKQLL